MSTILFRFRLSFIELVARRLKIKKLNNNALYNNTIPYKT